MFIVSCLNNNTFNLAQTFEGPLSIDANYIQDCMPAVHWPSQTKNLTVSIFMF